MRMTSRSSIATRLMKSKPNNISDGPLPLIPPGEVLAEDFMEPLAREPERPGSQALNIPPGRVNDIIHGRRSITPDTAVRLAIYFGTSVDFWINLQAHHDARVARRDLQPAIAEVVRPHVA